jgi:hypothetical protein
LMFNIVDKFFIPGDSSLKRNCNKLLVNVRCVCINN